jgi:pyruvate/2-oxoglutarate dehydrogenase complex dihydrolipoamide acyltransferase (E2) component
LVEHATEISMRLARYALACLLTLGAPALAAEGDALLVAAENVNVRAGAGLDSQVLMRVHRNQLLIELEREGDWVRGEIAGPGGQVGWIHGSLLARPGGERVAAPLGSAEPSAEQAEAAGEVPEPGAQPSSQASSQPSAAPPAPEPALPELTPEIAARQAPTPSPPEPATGRDDLPPEAERLAREAPSEPTTGPEAAGGPGPVGVAAARRPDEESEPTVEPTPAAGPPTASLSGIEQFRESVSYLNSRAVEVAGIELFTGVEAISGDVVRVHATDAWTTVPHAGQQSFLNTLLDRWLAAKGGGPASVQIANELGEVVVEKAGP